MFGVPLTPRKTYGYMFNDRITSIEEALADMREFFKTDAIDGREYFFKCYYANEPIQGRVGRNGNKAIFFEPLVANSIFLYIHSARVFYDYMMGFSDAQTANAQFVKGVQDLEDLISHYYSGGSTFQSKFWDAAVKASNERLKRREPYQKHMETYRNLYKQGILNTGQPYGLSAHNWKLIDRPLGYGNFPE